MTDSTNTIFAAKNSRPIFEIFPKLPIELRLKIYRIAVPEPRIIELVYDHGHNLGRVLQTQASPLLGTSREPREELLRDTRPLLAGNGEDCTVQMNFDRETLYIPLSSVPRLTPKEGNMLIVLIRAFMEKRTRSSGMEVVPTSTNGNMLMTCDQAVSGLTENAQRPTPLHYIIDKLSTEALQ